MSPESIVELCSKAGLQGVEWGGDVHCPHGDVPAARRAASLCRDAGLEVCSYGSYYKLGASENAGLPFAKVLESALALEAPRIRVWAGVKGSAGTDAAGREAVAEDLRRVVAMAGAEGVAISLEYHVETLTDDPKSSLALLASAPGALCQWQPIQGLSPEAKTASLKALAGPRLANLHVFEWGYDSSTRKIFKNPLSDGAELWREWLAMAASEENPNCRWALLEFVRDDAREQLLADAATLLEILPR